MTSPPPGGAGRDLRVIVLIGSAHGLSHFFQLTLPPLFPVLRDEFGVSYMALGFVMSLFYAVSGVAQTAAGFLVDRVGGHRVLLAGVALLAGAFVLAGLSPSFAMLVPIALLAGLGNSVFHPADYAILNASVDPRRLGRAYSVHGIGGNLGWAAAPAAIVTLAAFLGWRGALVTAGGLGLGAACVLGAQRGVLAQAPARPAGGRDGRARAPGAGARVLLTTPILSAFAYFALLAAALIGVQNFAVAAMVAVYDAPLSMATGGLTGFLLGSAGGILTGGLLADRTRRHDIVAGGGMLLGALFTLVVASAVPPLALMAVAMTLAGFCLGVTAPSRDMLVRAATPAGGSGKVFGFVYSGLDLGSAVTPLAYGWLMDRGEPQAVFLLAAGLMLLTIVTVAQVRRHGAPAPAHP